MKYKYKLIKKFLLLLFCLPLTVFFSVSVGSADLSAGESLRLLFSKFPFFGKWIDSSDLKEVYQTILFQVRLPRILLAGFVGAGLSLTGAVFQGLFRNPLADPHVLGVSSGAAIGATIAILSGIQASFLGLGAVGVCAFLGAMLTIFLVYQITCIRGQMPAVHLLLTGTAISTMLSACISLMMSLNREGIEKVYMWTLGSFSSASWTKVRYLGICLLISAVGLEVLANDFNLLLTGEDAAESMGVDLLRLRKRVVFLSSFLVASCVSVSGVIGFVGLIIPHCMRMINGSNYRSLIPFSLLGGAIFMIVCDTIARTVTAPAEIPVGVVTALIVAPNIIYLIYHNGAKRG